MKLLKPSQKQFPKTLASRKTTKKRKKFLPFLPRCKIEEKRYSAQTRATPPTTTEERSVAVSAKLHH